MANPFLMMDEEVGSPGTNEVASNPFLQDAPAEEFDNPFAAAQGTNPFAAFGDEEEPAPVNASVPPTTVADIFMPAKPLLVSKANTFHPIDPAMSFFGTTIDHEDDEPIEAEIKHPQLTQFDDGAAYSSEEELTRKKGPPPRPTPPSQTTQELIFAVADQLDAASSHLLNRIPKTRTPSPVSMRDLHSPSPTPDSAMGDLLDVSDGSFQATGQGSDFDVDLMGGCGTDNPFAPTSIPPMQAPAPPQPAGKAQPPRPPPPRPAPPRPSPPVTAPVPVQATPAQNIVQQQQQQQQPQEPDLFDIFGDSAPPSKPPAPKSKEDILSLFSKPVQPPPVQTDLLSGDILLDEIPESDVPLPPPLTEIISQPILPPPVEQPTFIQQQASEPLPVSTPPEAATPISEPAMPTSQTSPESEPVAEPEPAIEPAPPEPIAQEQPTTTITEPDHAALTEEPEQEVDSTQAVMDSIIPEVTYKRAPTPDIEITTVESLPRSDDEEEPQPELEKDEVNVETDQSPTADSSVTAAAMPESPIEFASSEPFGEPEQMDTGLDFAPSIPSGAASANPFASPEEEVYPQVPVENNIFAADEPLSTSTNIFAAEEPTAVSQATNIFAVDESQAANIFAVEEPNIVPQAANIFAAEPLSVSTSQSNIFELEGSHGSDEFDAFAAKFDSVKKDNVSLLDGFGGVTPTSTGDAWGDSDAFGGDSQTSVSGEGFGGDEGFDSFLALKAPESNKFSRKDSGDSPAEEKEFSVVIRPKYADASQGIAPVLAPPPPPRGSQNNSIYSGDSSPRINPFDKSDEVASADGFPAVPEPASMVRTDSQETPPTPLFDDDVSQPLEDFPRVTFTGTGWEMQLRQPNKKKITGQRFWKKIFMKLVFQGDNPVLQLFNQASDKEPFQELPLQPCYSVSEIGAQQYDQFGKIFTVKLQYIFYKERPGVRPGQVTKAERLTNKLSQFAAYAIQGDYQGVKEFGSDLKKLGLPVEHAPQVSQLFKIGSMSFEDLKQFSVCVEEALFKLPAHRDRALTYKSEEVQITAVDELYVEQDAEGHVEKQIARVRLFFLGFLSGMPSIELGVNDLWRQGKEVVGRHDIIPVVTEEWIRLEGVEFHNCVQQDEYERSRTIKFQPPDACYIELMRFRVRPPKNRELPLQLKATWCVTGNKVELRADILVPGFASRKLGQIPCEDVAVRFPIPECWIYLFRVEKHFRYGSVKSAHRRTGKIKGIERILGTVDTLQESLIEVTSGQAKYEHHHRAIVWRCPRLPKEGQGAYTTHQMVCRMALTSYDQIPEQLAPYCYVEFTMPATQVSHTTVRSVSVQESDSDEPPEKYVRYLARHEYRVGIESTAGESPNAYLAATRIKEEPVQQPAPPVPSPMAPSDTDSDSN